MGLVMDLPTKTLTRNNSSDASKQLPVNASWTPAPKITTIHLRTLLLSIYHESPNLWFQLKTPTLLPPCSIALPLLLGPWEYKNLYHQTASLALNLPGSQWFGNGLIFRGPCSKPLGGSKVDSAFHPSKVDKWVPGISGNLEVKSKLPPRSCCSLEAAEPNP